MAASEPERPGSDPQPHGARDAGESAVPPAEANRRSSFDLAFDETSATSESHEPSSPTTSIVVGADPAGDVARSQRGTVVVSQPSPSQLSRPSQRALAHARSFADGALLAGRFRIARFLGEGGMGEVYEAEDLELRERVALKTVRPEIAEDPRAWEEFRREVHLARKVTHPNVCRIFDVFHHHEGDVDVAFVTMELLPGETLQKRLKREGRLATAVVLPIARQMAAALAAAHARGVVHRDFKGANVMLVPAESGEGVRAVVTDFGLARGEAGGDDSFGTLHTAGRIAGTPAYMAPEQVTGGKVTPAIDVYALGVVLFELLTGKQPFVGESPLATAVMRLKENPPLPRTLVPDIDRRWETVILRCLEREPAARFASPVEALAALDDGGSRLLGRSLSLQVRRSPRAAAALGAGALLLLVLLGVWLARRSGAPAAAPPAADASAPAVPTKPTVAVMGFKNLRGEPDAAWLSTAIAEALRSELAAGSKLRLLPGESVERTKRDLALSDGEADAYPAETLERLRANLGSDWVVTGKYLSLGGQAPLTLYVHVQDAHSHATLDPVTERGPEDTLGEIVARCGVKLRAALGVGDVKDGDVAAARAAFSSNPTWARLYAEGLDKLRRYDAPTARLLLEKAVQADPKQPLGHWALAEAWYRLGYGLRAAASAKSAVDLAGGLSVEERLKIQARWHAYSGARAEAVESYRTLWKSSDNLDYGLDLANALLDAERAPEVPELVQALRGLPAPVGDDPRIDLVEIRTADKLSQFPRVVSLAEHAVAKGKAKGASLLVAEARRRQAWGYYRVRDIQQAARASSDARALYQAAGDRSGVAETLALDANLLHDEGRHDEAARAEAEAKAAFLAAGDRIGLANLFMNSLRSLAMRGELATVKQRVEQPLAVYREIGYTNGLASALGNVGEILFGLGQLDAAHRRLREAADLFDRLGDTASKAKVLSVLSGVQRSRADLAAARTSIEQARTAQLESGQKSAAASSRATLALLLLDEERGAEAEQTARAALDEARAAKDAQAEAWVLEVLALACLANDKAGEARAAFDQAQARFTYPPDSVDVMKTAITGARVRAANGGRDEAIAALQATLEKARPTGALDVELEARLALGELGAGGLDALVRDARRKGYELVARQAEQARRAAASRR